MPYILNKTNGAKITIVDDAQVDTSTDLFFVGRNYSGYGELVNENLLRLLENFSNTTPTPKPIIGQTWYNSSTDIKKLNVFDGKEYKSIANLHVSSEAPTYPTTGDLWWDENNVKLKIWDGNTYKSIGPSGSVRADWRTVEEIVESSTQPVIEGFFGSNVKITVSDVSFTPNVSSLLSGSDKFSSVKKGITLYGANPITGSTKDSGYYFWGTAAESLIATTSTNLSVTFTTTNSTFYVPFVNSSTGGVSAFTHSGVTYNPSSGVLTTIAAAALYADLAERYASDSCYDVGTVVVIGGTKEVTVTHSHADTAIAGVISQHPAYRMNSAAGPDDTHPYVALRGRVPCKVIGPVKKGALLVTSSYPGYAEAIKPDDNKNAVFAKALQDFSGPKGLVEVIVI